MHTDFLLDTQQCALLLDLESAGSLRALAALRGRDISAINRQLQRIGAVAPVIEKQHGKWVVSPLGRRLNEWTREAHLRQAQVLKARASLRIAAARDFAAVILAPDLGGLIDLDPLHHVSVITADDVESVLLHRRADLAFGCGRPTDPAVGFRSVKLEPFCLVASPEFLARHRIRNFHGLLRRPYLQYARATAPRLLQLARELSWVVASFDDIAATRSACLAGLGWTVLPTFSVAAELRAKRLKRIEGPRIPPETYGVWWPRGRKDLEPLIERAAAWLAARDLG